MRIAWLAAVVVLGAASSSPAIPPCSQPVSDGAIPALSDCLHVARASVGIAACAACVCDADGSGATTISDALHCMRVSVGADVELDCPECTGSTTTTTLPGCASCNDVLTGARQYEDLCSLAKFVYEEMESCPTGRCGCACGFPQVCVPDFDCCDLDSRSAAACLSCLGSCLDTVANCQEN